MTTTLRPAGMPPRVRKCEEFPFYLTVDGSHPSWDMLRLAYRSIAPLVVVPAQDLLGLGSDARFNEPGHPFGNWKWRLDEDAIGAIGEPEPSYLAEQAKITGRLANSNEIGLA